MMEYYSYQAGGCGVESTTPYLPFLEGGFLHYALMHYYKSGRMQRVHLENRAKAIIDETRDSHNGLDPVIDNKLQVALWGMTGACMGYKEVYRGDKDKYEILFVEEPFEFEFEGVVIAGVVDMLVREKESDKLIVWENKSTKKYNPDDYAIMPMDFQDLLYCIGSKQLLDGEYPDMRLRNVIVKTGLRRKGKDANIESLASYEARVIQQYQEEPDKKFIRTQPRRVLKTTLNNVLGQLKFILEQFKMAQGKPYMNFSQCKGMYGQACPYAMACTERLQGHAEGWNAPACRGAFRAKESQHPELTEAKANLAQAKKDAKGA